MTKHILIIGGMGPQASVELHKRILDVAIQRSARKGEDFPRITHLSLPIKEFRSDTAHVNRAFGQIKRAVSGFSLEGDLRAVLACNTAHIFQGAVEGQLQRPLISLIELAVAEARRRGVGKVGLLASETTLKERIYEQQLEAAGITTLLPSKAEQRIIANLIGRVIAGEDTPADHARLLKLTHSLQDRGCQATILGCTELSVLCGLPDKDVIDPLNLAAHALND